LHVTIQDENQPEVTNDLFVNGCDVAKRALTELQTQLTQLQKRVAVHGVTLVPID
jgi:hypothetical protein